MMVKALIVGGGLAGLTAGYELRKQGWEVVVLEKAAYPGGRSATHREGGYIIDTAATQITSGYTEYIALANELGLSSHLKRSCDVVGFLRNGRIYELDGSSNTSAVFSGIIGWGAKLRLLGALNDVRRVQPPVDYLDISNNYRHDDENVRDYAQRRLGKDAYEYLIGPLLRGNFQRWSDEVSKLDLFAILSSFSGQRMFAMAGGIERLPRTLAERLHIRLNAEVKQVEQRNGRVHIALSSNGQINEDQADVCVLATRVHEAVMICPEYASIASEVARRLEYTRGTLVHLGYRRATRTKILGLFIPRLEQEDITLLWLEHNKLPDTCPPGHSLITCYIDDRKGGPADQPDDVLIAKARAYVERLFPELTNELDITRVSRWPMAIPFARPGTYAEIHKLRSRIDPASRIQPAGDYFTCVGQNAAIFQGRQTAKRILEHHRSE